MNKESDSTSVSNETVSPSNQYYFGVLGCRLLAIYMVAVSFDAVVRGVISYGLDLYDAIWVGIQVHNLQAILSDAFGPSGGIVIGLVYWFSADNIARRMFRGCTDPLERPRIDLRGWMSIAVAAAGAGGALRAISHITTGVVMVLVPELSKWQSEGVQSLAEGVVMLPLSLWFLFGSPGIARWLVRMQANEPSPLAFGEKHD